MFLLLRNFFVKRFPNLPPHSPRSVLPWETSRQSSEWTFFSMCWKRIFSLHSQDQTRSKTVTNSLVCTFFNFPELCAYTINDTTQIWQQKEISLSQAPQTTQFPVHVSQAFRQNSRLKSSSNSMEPPPPVSASPASTSGSSSNSSDRPNLH